VTAKKRPGTVEKAKWLAVEALHLDELEPCPCGGGWYGKTRDIEMSIHTRECPDQNRHPIKLTDSLVIPDQP